LTEQILLSRLREQQDLVDYLNDLQIIEDGMAAAR
jgi:hypothetical protein